MPSRNGSAIAKPMTARPELLGRGIAELRVRHHESNLHRLKTRITLTL